jgi:methionyl-tRNA formyltransferase
MQDKLKVVFFGTPEFSVPSLDVLYNSENIDLIKVVTMPDRPAGRGKKLQSPPVALYAKENNIPLHQTSNINNDLDLLNEIANADFFLVIAFAQFLNDKVLNIPKLGCFNIHTSLLPKYRGAAPIQYALLNGDSVTGVTIQKMVKKMDAGDIAYSKEVDISDDDTSDTLFKKLEKEAAISLGEFIPLLRDNKITYKKQDESLVSFAPTIKKLDGKIDFHNESAVAITNKFKAYYPWPGVFFYLNNVRIKVHEITNSKIKLNPGEVHTDMGEINIGCKEGSLHFKRVQVDGKKPCTDTDLLRGLKNKYSSFEVTNE